ncbi:MAG TPA: carbon-nitrogen hydrolase family protein [Gemmatimonadales bacterium]|nr:carbon-nitrogen hydrolase family protein [Gemmatimonadales bacterium]
MARVGAGEVVIRIALASIRPGATPEESVNLAVAAVAEAGRAGAAIICFPECYIPGYRWPDSTIPAPDVSFLKGALEEVSAAARSAHVAVILGTERVTDHGLQISAAVIGPDGAMLGWQDKVQLDPAEEPIYPAIGEGRCIFTLGDVKFGVVICHEGWRYPETVRWAARRGAQVVFHPHADRGTPEGKAPASFAAAAGSFHEKAILCRAAENTCYFASVNYAAQPDAITSAIARPDGTLLCHQPHGEEGLLVADLDLTTATGLLASRCRA